MSEPLIRSPYETAEELAETMTNAVTINPPTSIGQVELPNISNDHLTVEEIATLNVLNYVNIPLEYDTMPKMIDFLNNENKLLDNNNPEKYLELGIINQSTYEKQVKAGEAFAFAGMVDYESVQKAAQAIENNPRLMALIPVQNDDFGPDNRLIIYENTGAKELVVTMRGTGPRQWLDNGHGVIYNSSKVKDLSLPTIQKYYEENYWGYDLTLSGHSKGGNTAEHDGMELQYKYLDENFNVRTISLDGQSQSAAYLKANPEKVAAFSSNPYNVHVALTNDYVHMLARLGMGETVYQTTLKVYNPTPQDFILGQHFVQNLFNWSGIEDGGSLRFAGWNESTGTYDQYPPGVLAVITGKISDRIVKGMDKNPELMESFTYFVMSFLQVEKSGFEGVASGRYIGVEEFWKTSFSDPKNIMDLTELALGIVDDIYIAAMNSEEIPIGIKAVLSPIRGLANMVLSTAGGIVTVWSAVVKAMETLKQGVEYAKDKIEELTQTLLELQRIFAEVVSAAIDFTNDIAGQAIEKITAPMQEAMDYLRSEEGKQQLRDLIESGGSPILLGRAFAGTKVSPPSKGATTLSSPVRRLRRVTGVSGGGGSASSGRIKFTQRDINSITQALRKAEQYMGDLEHSVLRLQRDLSRERDDDDLTSNEKRELSRLEKASRNMLQITSNSTIKTIRTNLDENVGIVHDIDKTFANIKPQYI